MNPYIFKLKSNSKMSKSSQGAKQKQIPPRSGGSKQSTSKDPARNPKPSSVKSTSSKGTLAVAGRSQQMAVTPFDKMEPIPFRKEGGMLVPEGYTMRKIEPAKNYDVVSFARAMNDDFAPRLKKLFDPETEAAIEAQKTGLYIGWRCRDFKHDCQRVSKKSKCFCGHLLMEHDKYHSRSIHVPCKNPACSCKAFAWIPARPEEIGEFWHQRRRNFDPSQWRAKCKCKHNHEQHDPNGMHRCKARGCPCGAFVSDFLCAACDRHWENHETIFESEDDRLQNGLPIGEQYLPFAEMPDLRNIALTGQENDDSVYRALTEGEGSIPRTQRPSGNDAPVNFGAGTSKSGFKPVYD